jgi:hypothetical protein
MHVIIELSAEHMAEVGLAELGFVYDIARRACASSRLTSSPSVVGRSSIARCSSPSASSGRA